MTEGESKYKKVEDEKYKEWFATIMSWGIIITIVLIMVALMYFLFESFAAVGTQGLGGLALFAMIISYSIGLFILVIGALIIGLFALILVFALLIKSGQRFFLKLIFKIEEKV